MARVACVGVVSPSTGTIFNASNKSKVELVAVSGFEPVSLQQPLTAFDGSDINCFHDIVSLKIDMSFSVAEQSTSGVDGDRSALDKEFSFKRLPLQQLHNELTEECAVFGFVGSEGGWALEVALLATLRNDADRSIEGRACEIHDFVLDVRFVDLS